MSSLEQRGRAVVRNIQVVMRQSCVPEHITASLGCRRLRSFLLSAPLIPSATTVRRAGAPQGPRAGVLSPKIASCVPLCDRTGPGTLLCLRSGVSRTRRGACWSPLSPLPRRETPTNESEHCFSKKGLCALLGKFVYLGPVVAQRKEGGGGGALEGRGAPTSRRCNIGSRVHAPLSCYSRRRG
jgi:hypothetical protein